ncbi:hypothetical protein HK096_007980, partial [Nowakowskiella sp. JEL0078]
AHGPLIPGSSLANFLHQGIHFIEAISCFNHKKVKEIPVYKKKNFADTTITSFKVTYLGGVLTMLDALLLHRNGNSRVAASEPVHKSTIIISLNGIRALNNMARLDVEMVQNVLTLGSMQIELFHLVAFWLSYWTSFNNGSNRDLEASSENLNVLLDDLLHELLIFIGYVAMGDSANQAILRFGQGPDPDNRQILKEEMSLEHLSQFIKSKKGKETVDIQTHVQLLSRFPPELWDNALDWMM